MIRRRSASPACLWTSSARRDGVRSSDEKSPGTMTASGARKRSVRTADRWEACSTSEGRSRLHGGRRYSPPAPGAGEGGGKPVPTARSVRHARRSMDGERAAGTDRRVLQRRRRSNPIRDISRPALDICTPATKSRSCTLPRPRVTPLRPGDRESGEIQRPVVTARRSATIRAADGQPHAAEGMVS